LKHNPTLIPEIQIPDENFADYIGNVVYMVHVTVPIVELTTPVILLIPYHQATACFHDIQRLTLIWNYVKCKRFLRWAYANGHGCRLMVWD